MISTYIFCLMLSNWFGFGYPITDNRLKIKFKLFILTKLHNIEDISDPVKDLFLSPTHTTKPNILRNTSDLKYSKFSDFYKRYDDSSEYLKPKLFENYNPLYDHADQEFFITKGTTPNTVRQSISDLKYNQSDFEKNHHDIGLFYKPKLFVKYILRRNLDEGERKKKNLQLYDDIFRHEEQDLLKIFRPTEDSSLLEEKDKYYHNITTEEYLSAAVSSSTCNNTIIGQHMVKLNRTLNESLKKMNIKKFSLISAISVLLFITLVLLSLLFKKICVLRKPKKDLCVPLVCLP